MKPTITSRGVSFPRPVGDEKTEQANIVNLATILGARIYVLGTRRAQYCGVCGTRTTDQGTRQTEGLSDLALFLPPPPDGRRPASVPHGTLPPPWVFVWVECKGKAGTLSPEQVSFREINAWAGVAHVVGGLEAFEAFLVDGGWILGSTSRGLKR